MGLIDIDKIAPDTDQKILWVLMIVFWFLSFYYYSPEQTDMLLDSVWLYNIPPGYDLPSIIPIILFFWMIIGLIDAAYIHLKVISDVAIADGMDYTESCIGSKLHPHGDWGWIRVGGTKAFPTPGTKVWIGLLSHIHKIGTHVVFEGMMIPNMVLDFLPYDLKLDIWQRREGLFGVKNCSIGILSVNELKAKKEFNTENFKEYIPTDEGTTPKTINTAQFILEFFIKNKTINTGLQLVNNDNEGLKRGLKTIRDASGEIRNEKERGIVQQIFGG